ncbi:MAG: hypothetical protein ACREID_09445 [Planctomycetota bacterium]
MQLRVLREPVVTGPVKIPVPRDGGQVEPVEVKLRLRAIKRSSLSEDLSAVALALALPNGSAAIGAIMNEASGSIARKLEEHLLGWEEEGLVRLFAALGATPEELQGVQFPCTPENKAGLLDLIFVQRAVLQAVLEVSRGEAAAGKNS